MPTNRNIRCRDAQTGRFVSCGLGDKLMTQRIDRRYDDIVRSFRLAYNNKTKKIELIVEWRYLGGSPTFRNWSTDGKILGH